MVPRQRQYNRLWKQINKRQLRRWRYIIIALSTLVLICVLIQLYTSLLNLNGTPNDVAIETLGPTVSVVDLHSESFDRPIIVGTKNYTQLSFNLPYEQEWRQNAHLVVYGVLATDKAERRSIRDMQRSTWLRYPDVATRHTTFNGLMLVLYAVAPFAHISPNVTVAMMNEMDEHHDVLMLRMKEEAPTTRKGAGKHGRYGIPFHVSNSRKLLFYLLYAHYAFPTTPFIAKGDDDSYVYVPEYMRMVRQLPRINVVYGSVDRISCHRSFQITLGYSYLISRDIFVDTVSEHMVSYLFNSPFRRDYSGVYFDVGFVAEDWLVGRTLDRLLSSGKYSRPMPPLPAVDDRLPVVEGWGKHYMAYILHPENNTAHTGRAVSSDGHYNVKYTFPPPHELKAGNVLWVDDVCRINNQRWPNATEGRGLIVAHRPITADQFRAYSEHYSRLGDSAIKRPHRIDVMNALNGFSDVFLRGLGRCEPLYGV